MQVSGLGITPTASQIFKSEGVAAFWKGLPFAYGRELSYSKSCTLVASDRPVVRNLMYMYIVQVSLSNSLSCNLLYSFPTASIKLGAYAPVRDAIGAGGPDAPIYLKFLAGAMTGGVGSVFGNPFDVLKSK
jgi:hypothetical protein